MKVEIFCPVIYYGDVAESGWPVSPRIFDAAAGERSIRCGFEQIEAAHKAGFDSLNLAEHHYSTSQMTPSPHMYAAALGQRLPSAHIAIYGTDLPLHNPLFVAEQYAVLDTLLGGRLSFGLLRGTPNEYLTYGTNPWESRERFEEAVELIIRAFTEPEPFGWEGRYFRFRNVAVFPQPVQDPHPRILLSGVSSASARFAGRMKCDVGFSFMPLEAAAANVQIYREAAEDAGWTPTADNILYRQFVYVGETDEQAQTEITACNWPYGGGSFVPRQPELMEVFGICGAAMAGAPKGAPVDLSKALMFAPPWSGSPDTVLQKIREAEQIIGMGRVEMIITGFGGTLTHEQVMRSTELMGDKLVPALHS